MNNESLLGIIREVLSENYNIRADIVPGHSRVNAKDEVFKILKFMDYIA